MRTLKRVLIGVGILIGAVAILGGGLAAYYLNRTGFFTTVEDNSATVSCQVLDLPQESAEDVIVDRGAMVAYYSGLDRRARAHIGMVRRIDLNASPWTITAAIKQPPADFHPHGMSLFAGPDGGQTLMVISHVTPEKNTVEFFDRDADGMFVHAHTATGPELFAPNDLAAVGPRQFYLVNDKGARTPVQSFFEQIFGAGYSTLVHYDGSKLSEVVHDLASPGGVNVTADGRQILIAETQGKRIRVMRRDPATEALTEDARIALNALPDNIDIALDGSAWVVSHVSAAALVGHFINPANPAPTVTHRLTRDANGKWTPVQVYATDGHNLSAASVAASHSGGVLLGSITEYKILNCAIKAGA